jgi:RNA polymerase sigma-70 factor (ECF subfamily)
MNTGLIERAMNGDHEAFSIIAARNVDRLYGIARIILRDPELAQDATQEALVRAWRDIRSLREPDRFDAWMYRLLLRSCQAERRKRRAWTDRIHVLPIGGDDGIADSSATPSSWGTAVDGVLDRDQIDRAMKRLTPEQRTVLVLHYYLDLPVSDGAELLRIPSGTFKSRLHQARSILRAAIDADDRLVMPHGKEGVA